MHPNSSPYYQVRKGDFDYEWAVVPSEIEADELTNKLFDFYSQLLQNLQNREDPLKFEQPIIQSYPPDSAIKLSAKVIDDVLAPFLPHVDKLIGPTMKLLVRLLEKNCSIAIDFHDIFLLKDGEDAPEHFRPNVDLRVNNLKEYKAHVSKLSSIFSNTILNAFRPPESAITAAEVPPALRAYYSSNKRVNKDPLTTPLKQLRRFNHIAETNYFIHGSTSNYFFLSFGPAFEPQDLKYLTRKWDSTQNEFILIFWGEQYNNLETRRVIYEEVLKAINVPTKHNEAIFQVFFLTNETDDHTLQTIIPDLKMQQDGFSPLAGGAGYYLSDSAFFFQTFRIIQASKPSKLVEAALKEQKDSTPFGSPSRYVYRPIGTDNVRASKHHTKQILKSHVTYSLTQQLVEEQTETQTQASVQEQQELTQQLQLNNHQNQNTQGMHLWTPGYNFEEACEELRDYAKRILTASTMREHRAEECAPYYTKFHKDNNLCRKLIEDNDFLVSVVARIFGLGTQVIEGKLVPIYLTKYSIDKIEHLVYQCLIEDIETLIDGLESKNRTFSTSFLFSTRVLTALTYTGMRCHISYQTQMYTSLLSEAGRGRYRDHFGAYVLLSAQALAQISTEKQLSLITAAESLLNLFNKNTSQIPSYEQLLSQLNVLIDFYFHAQPEYLRIWSRFLSIFTEENEDNLKIILQVIISGHLEKFEEFFKLLLFLESRCLLEVFYKLFFKYSHNVMSVTDLLNGTHNWSTITTRIIADGGRFERHADFESLGISNVYINLFSQTPAVSSSADWPSFEKFWYHFLVTAAEKNVKTLHSHFIEAQKLWQRLGAKLLINTEKNPTRAQELIKDLATNLVAYGSSLLPSFGQATTFFVGLENLIDHAISRGALEEQIREITGLSFLWLDVPYALENNGFQVICAEMRITSDAIDPISKRYSVTEDELTQFLKTASLNTSRDTFKTTLFRYLGTQSLREELAYYRSIIHENTSSVIDEKTLFIKYLILGYFILTTTGPRAQSQINREQFCQDFRGFLNSNHNHVEPALLSSCLEAFFVSHEHTPRDEQKGTSTLWRLWLDESYSAFINQTPSLPDILTYKFDKKNVLSFIRHRQDELRACLHFFDFKSNPQLPFLLLEGQFKDLTHASHKRRSISLLRELYPQLSMEKLLVDIEKIELFSQHYSKLIELGIKSQIYRSLKMISKNHDIDLVNALLELLLHVLAFDNKDQHIARASVFLKTLAQRPLLLSNITRVWSQLTMLGKFYVNSIVKPEVLIQTLDITEVLINLDAEKATQTLATILTSIRTNEGAQFFQQHPQLTAEQFFGVSQILDRSGDFSITIPFLEHCLQKNPTEDFSDILTTIADIPQEKILLLFTLCKFIEDVAWLSRLKQLPLETLSELVRILKLHQLDIPTLLSLIASASVIDAINDYERSIYATNSARYEYDTAVIREKIAQIKFKSYEEQADIPLSMEEQENLLNDYQNLMSYMTTNPVLIERNQDEQETSFTIQQLNEKQFKILFRHLKDRIAQENPRQYQIMLLALGCEALYRVTKKFPRSTQILCVLNGLHHDGNLIQEMKTGEGKSIAAALQNLLFVAEGTVEVATENDKLARDGLNEFKRFFAYFGVPTSDSVIQAHSPRSAYVENGVNYSTPALALFRLRMRLERQPLPKKVFLVFDEVDAGLTTTVQFRLAATLNALLHDTQSWSFIYKSLLAFVNDRELFTENQCTSLEDVQNFRNFFLIRNPEKTLAKLMQALTDKEISELIDSAKVALALEEGEDYLVVNKTKEQETCYYAAPIIDTNKRANAKVSYGAGVHQLLHTHRNSLLKSKNQLFEVEAPSETLVVIGPHDFVGDYAQNAGKMIGFTATAGSIVELKEFYQENGIKAYSYPKFHADQCQDLGIFAAIGQEAHFQTILSKIEEYKQARPGQAFLVITSSPRLTELLTTYLSQHTDWPLQNYNGYEQVDSSESRVIQIAGTNFTVTIANESLARGVDIDPEHAEGLFVINACTDVTESELEQIRGRTARNGRNGWFCSIINAEQLGDATTSSEEMRTRFQAHQHSISLRKQNERQKTRFLEKVRHYVINNYMFAIKECADKVLCRQLGQGSYLITSEQFLIALRDFNQYAEERYMQALSNNASLDQVASDEFLREITTYFQQMLNDWLPEQQFQRFDAIEPLIPLENLNTFTALDQAQVDQILIISAFWSTIWKSVGNQEAHAFFENLDKLTTIYTPYFRQERSFQHVTAEALLQNNVLTTDNTLAAIDDIEKILFSFIKIVQELPLIGRFIPIDAINNFVTNYTQTTKQQIREKRWDDLALPKPDLSSVQTWYGRISKALTAGSLLFGGPIPFIVNRILLPAITSLLKNLFASSESTVFQILFHLNNITDDISNALTALLSADSQTMTLGAFLDKIAPLLKNKAFLILVSQLLELNNKKSLNRYLDIVPIILQTLEPYKEKTLQEAFNLETLMVLFQQGAQSESGKEILERFGLKKIAAHLFELKPEFLAQFHALSFTEFIGFTKVIAHPNFFAFLSTVPQETTFNELKRWLQDMSVAPEAVRAGLTELRDYQTQRERIERDAQQTITTLKARFSLSVEKLKEDLNRQEPARAEVSQPIVINQEEEPQTTTTSASIPWLKYSGIAALFASIVLLNVYFFTYTLLLTSALFVGGVVYPYVTELLFPVSKLELNMEVARVEAARIVQRPAQPIVINTNRLTQVQTLSATTRSMTEGCRRIGLFHYKQQNQLFPQEDLDLSLNTMFQ